MEIRNTQERDSIKQEFTNHFFNILANPKYAITSKQIEECKTSQKTIRDIGNTLDGPRHFMNLLAKSSEKTSHMYTLDYESLRLGLPFASFASLFDMFWDDVIQSLEETFYCFGGLPAEEFSRDLIIF